MSHPPVAALVSFSPFIPRSARRVVSLDFDSLTLALIRSLSIINNPLLPTVSLCLGPICECRLDLATGGGQRWGRFIPMTMSTERDFKRRIDKQAPAAPATTSNITQRAPNIHPAETIVFAVDSAVHIVRHTLCCKCYRCVRICSGTFVDAVF